MQIRKLAVLVASLALPLLAAAAPTESEPPAPKGFGTTKDLEGLQVSAANTLKVCQDSNLSGPCMTWSIPDRTCYHIGDAWNDRVSSFETSGMYCFLFRDRGCRGGWFGASGRVNSMGAFNDQTTSFQCNV
ncbi:hypothetical protein LY78DRAFT_667305 [Colletotrichum sublineola]|uniref:Beta/gamma crystallin 'Greek key' domain-containing protein n=1 Tax=Colletotrichum sublineola TaxID=1173701 RepID=A0A066WSR8_COLSU|nr:hypothetical protein LY78DRAFT_667305 [Colletotrichum sublineola]KDN59943.1 hypothetical protein CSUB01_08294 [Colletotrichum sublineola]